MRVTAERREKHSRIVTATITLEDVDQASNSVDAGFYIHDAKRGSTWLDTSVWDIRIECGEAKP